MREVNKIVVSSKIGTERMQAQDCCVWLLTKLLSVVSDCLCPDGLQPARLLLCLWDSPGKNTGVGCHALLWGIFLIQGSSPHLLLLLYWQAGSLPPVSSRASLAIQMVKNLPVIQETRVQFLDQEDPLEEGMVIHSPVFLPERSHGQRSLADYSPQGCKESDITSTFTVFQDNKILNYGLIFCSAQKPFPFLLE